jgi:hypothetical protein
MEIEVLQKSPYEQLKKNYPNIYPQISMPANISLKLHSYKNRLFTICIDSL